MPDVLVLVFALIGEPKSYTVDMPRADCLAMLFTLDPARVRFACCYPRSYYRGDHSGGRCIQDRDATERGA